MTDHTAANLAERLAEEAALLAQNVAGMWPAFQSGSPVAIVNAALPAIGGLVSAFNPAIAGFVPVVDAVIKAGEALAAKKATYTPESWAANAAIVNAGADDIALAESEVTGQTVVIPPASLGSAGSRLSGPPLAPTPAPVVAPPDQPAPPATPAPSAP